MESDYKDLNEKTEQEIRKSLAQNENNTVSGIKKQIEGVCGIVIGLSATRIYISNKNALPIADASICKALHKQIEKTLSQAFENIQVIILHGVNSSWKLGESFVFTELNRKVPDDVLKSYCDRGVFSHREKAMNEFINRKISGIKLSDRIWNLKNGLQNEIETAIQFGVSEGKSAIEIARDLKKYLNAPDVLFRRIKDANGGLTLSNAARNYHPGKGIYRSSHKNALRLARNEINKACRLAEWYQIQDLDFVIGFRIGLSNNHPIKDICDDLAGLYPKTFRWSSWHVGCRCHMTSELVSQTDFIKMQNDTTFKPKQYSAYPANIKKWGKDNIDRYKPGLDWIDENQEIKNLFKKS